MRGILIVLQLLIIIIFFNCNTVRKYIGTYQSDSNHFYSAMVLDFKGIYRIKSRTDLIQQEGSGTWSTGKDDTIILNSRYKEHDIPLHQENTPSTSNNSPMSFINVRSEHNGEFYDLIDCIIFINDTIRL